MEKVINLLQKEVDEFKNVTNKRLVKFDLLLDSVINQIKNSNIDIEKFDYNGYGIRRFGNSKVGYFYYFCQLSDNKTFPSNVKYCNSFIYIANNFNVKVDFMSCDEALDAVQSIPAYIENAYNIINEYKNKFGSKDYDL